MLSQRYKRHGGADSSICSFEFATASSVNPFFWGGEWEHDGGAKAPSEAARKHQARSAEGKRSKEGALSPVLKSEGYAPGKCLKFYMQICTFW